MSGLLNWLTNIDLKKTNMEKKTFDLKTIAIIILGVALIISFFFGQKSNSGDSKDEIQKLKDENVSLALKNDSIKHLNEKLDKEISDINSQVVANNEKLSTTLLELDKLKKERHEIPSKVARMSGDGVSSAFSKYLQDRTKSKNNNN